MHRPVQSSDSYSLLFGMVLIPLVMSCLLTACRDRTVLSAGKNDKMHVAGQVVSPGSAQSSVTAGGVTSAAGPDAALGVNAVTVWFVKAENDKLGFVSESRDHGAAFAGKVDAMTFALNELLAGPRGALQSAGASSEIPPGTVLIGVSEDKATGDITIDLSRRFSQGAGPDSFESRIEQVRRTASAVAADKNIYLDVEGKRLEASAEGLEVRQPISGPAGKSADSPEP